MPLFTSVSFDLTVTSIFTPLISGSSVVIYDETEIVSLMDKVFKTDYPSVIKMTPAHMNLLRELSYNNKNIRDL